MRGWQTQLTLANRWTGGSVQERQLSEDEATVYKELGLMHPVLPGYADP
jgi:hypothetical protein